ncbi:S-layer family protein [Paenibacillus taihuensis]|uniref:mannan endo-1,4-beta-mannosidase n=1 Tax=Paenibacillus taihuensis TaxID=1156355 RepID=A0A3D9RYT0_9BACL|nr:carbohydrate binding domain-containing protein [Paenibacillus taihuensis]REE85149.1 S-layer family protein [Paenibacillus taihuensis]
MIVIGRRLLSAAMAGMLVVSALAAAVLPSGRAHADEAEVPAGSGFAHYITRDSDKLMDGTDEFRFISANVPTLSMVEDISWRTPDAWEQEDAMKTLVQLGGTATRPYVFSVHKPDDTPDMKRAVMGPGQFDENVFKAFDKQLQLANQYGIRIIVPFVDQYEWQGGIASYAAFRGKGKDQFWSDSQLIGDFKQTINYVLNRVNTYTGIPYKDDPAILAWETGNELVPASHTWTHDIASYIKSIDSHHLVLDGKYGIDDASLSDDAIDLVSNHYYPDHYPDYALQVNLDKAKTAGKKPFIVGEFGFKPTDQVGQLLDSVIDNGTSGAMIWSLRYHNRDGGFYPHTESTFGGVFYGAYRWPGFPSGNGFDETNLLQTLRAKAFAIRGIDTPPPIPAPDAPELLPIDSVSAIGWKGSVGASSYAVERAENGAGPWTSVGSQVYDAVPSATQLLNDTTAVSGTSYYYRVKAVNGSGESGYSNVVGPVAAAHAIIDPIRNYDGMYDYSTDLEFTSKDAAGHGDDWNRLKALPASSPQYVAYGLPLDSEGNPVAAAQLTATVYLDAAAAAGTNFAIEASPDGTTYSPLNASAADETSGAYVKRTYTTGQLPDGTRTVRIVFPEAAGAGELGNVRIAYTTDGSGLTFPDSIRRQTVSDGVLTDEFNNFLKMDSHTANLSFASDNINFFGGDEKRLNRTSNTNESFTYKADGDMNYFQFIMYARQNPNEFVLPDFTFYASADGANYTAVTDYAKKATPGEGYWAKTEYTAYKLPSGTRYLKFEFPLVPDSYKDQAWNPEASSLRIGIGSAKLDPPPDLSKSAIIDDFESYSGSSTNMRSAYMINTSGSALQISLSGDAKASGNYGMKLETNMEQGWGGFEKNVSGANWSGSSGIELWVNPNGADIGLSIQFTEDAGTGGEVWKGQTRVSGSEPVHVKLPFSSFSIPDWWLNSHPSVGNRQPDLNGPVSAGIYLDGAAGAKTIYLDDFKLYRDPVVDRFESYGGDDAKLRAVYTPNASGDAVTLSLNQSEKHDGDYGMKLEYELTDAKGYAGITKNMQGVDWSGSSGISLWVKPDGANRGLTVQVREASGEYWEAKAKLSGTDGTELQIPFHTFRMPGWSALDNGKLDVNAISEFSIYLDKGDSPAGSGSILFDSITAAPIGTIDNFEFYQGNSDAAFAAYIANASGDSAVVSLSSEQKSEGRYGMKLSYALTEGKGYAGVTRQLGRMNWSAAGNALQLQLVPDGSGRLFTVQFKEADGDTWESRLDLTGTTAKQETLPFSGFGRSIWSTGDGVMDLTAVAEYSLYINTGSAEPGNGAVVVDDVKLATVPVLDSYDYYDEGTELIASRSYSSNPWGGTVTLYPNAEHKLAGKYGLKYTYELPDASRNFAGITKTLGSMSWSEYDGLKLWLIPDGSGRKLTIQFKEPDGETWESYVPLNGTAPVKLALPLSGFVHAPWNNTGNGTLDLGSISEFSFYVNQGDGQLGTGVLYFDEVGLYKGDAYPGDDGDDNGSGGNGGNGGNGQPQQNAPLLISGDNLAVSGNTAVIQPDSGQEVRIADGVANRLDGHQLKVTVGGAALLLSPQWLKLADAQSPSQSQLSLKLTTQSSADVKLPGNGREHWQTAGDVVRLDLPELKESGSPFDRMRNDHAKLELAYDRNADSSQLGIYRYDEKSGSWVYVGGRVDAEAGVITASIDQPGEYAVLAFSKTYNDVPEQHWAYTSISQLTSRHALEGVSETDFAPGATVTRAQFIAMLIRSLGSSGTNASQAAQDKWYAPIMEEAVKAGLVQGHGDGKYAPEAQISRQEMAVLLMRFRGLLSGMDSAQADNGGLSKSAFTDDSAIAKWALGAVHEAAADGILQGNNNEFRPAATATRAEAAAAIIRLLNRMEFEFHR